jgi:hypothetical protein
MPSPPFGLSAGAVLAGTWPAHAATAITTDDNADMTITRKPSPRREQAAGDEPGRVVVLGEGVLRRRATAGIVAEGGRFDVATPTRPPTRGARRWRARRGGGEARCGARP